MRRIVAGESELESVVFWLGGCIQQSHAIVLLRGNLASGKTTLVKEFVKSLGIGQDVTSPTFSIQSIYGDKIFHYDIYNISTQEFLSLGLLEELEKEGIHFIEWADENLEEVLKTYGFEYIIIEIKPKNSKREYICIH